MRNELLNRHPLTCNLFIYLTALANIVHKMVMILLQYIISLYSECIHDKMAMTVGFFDRLLEIVTRVLN